jgi:hypothetical protein
MSRPLVISDCDEVLLHMVAPFGEWLDEEHGIHFDMAGGDFARAMKRRECGSPVPLEHVWPLLKGFFDGQMHRQYPIAGAVESIGRLREHADVVVLTNLGDDHREARRRQLLDHGIDLKVYTNQGPKGPALQAILEEYAPSTAVFIDDLPQHHGSVKDIAPHVSRLHLCGEPRIAPHIVCAGKSGDAHARIDDWATALPWIVERLYQTAP